MFMQGVLVLFSGCLRWSLLRVLIHPADTSKNFDKCDNIRRFLFGFIMVVILCVNTNTAKNMFILG